MENFFNYISKPVHPDDVQVWLNINNIIPEKVDLYSDFTSSLYSLILNTYLGEDDNSNESNIKLTEEDNTKHFDWCWKKTIENFTKENIKFYSKGEHYDHFKSFFDEVYYNQKEQKVKDQIGVFFEDLFDLKKPFTKSDIDMLTDLYKSLDKNLKK
jgi:hypothetical protein